METCQQFQKNLWFLTNQLQLNTLNVLTIKKLILFNTYFWTEHDLEALRNASKIKLINLGNIEEMVEMSKLTYMWFLQILLEMAKHISTDATVDTTPHLVVCTKLQDQIWEQSYVALWQDTCTSISFNGDMVQKHILMATGNLNIVQELNMKICQMWNERLKLLVDSTVHGGLAEMPFEQNAALATLLLLAHHESLNSFHDQVNHLIVSKVLSVREYQKKSK